MSTKLLDNSGERDLEMLPEAFVEIYEADDDEMQAPVFQEDYLGRLEERAKERLHVLLKDQPDILWLSEQIFHLRKYLPLAGDGKVRASVNKALIACVLEMEAGF